jgi:hypothetical protein
LIISRFVFQPTCGVDIDQSLGVVIVVVRHRAAETVVIECRRHIVNDLFIIDDNVVVVIIVYYCCCARCLVVIDVYIDTDIDNDDIGGAAERRAAACRRASRRRAPRRKSPSPSASSLFPRSFASQIPPSSSTCHTFPICYHHSHQQNHIKLLGLRVPYFAALFNSGLADASKHDVSIPDVTSEVRSTSFVRSFADYLCVLNLCALFATRRLLKRRRRRRRRP